MKIQFLPLTTLTLLALLGAGCSLNSRMNPPSSSPSTPASTSASSFAFSTVSTNTRPGWKLYIANNPKFQIEIPATWKIGEYISPSNPSELLSVAFDPFNVLSQEEFQSLDRAPGQVWIDLTSLGSAADVPTIKKIGPKNIEAHYTKDITGTNSPNGWWIEKTQEKYTMAGPNNSIINLNLYYPNSETTDKDLQNILKDIVGSFQF
jgi:hypothetical protein